MTKGELYDLKLLQKNFEENEVKVFPADFDEIKAFQNKYNIEIPLDLQNYYLELNGSGNAALNNLYEFYSINRTKKISEELINWKGIPDYSKLNFEGIENVFVFGEYQFNLYVFGIELHPDLSLNNRIFILCGEDFKIIADSFTEFIDLYLNKPEEIYI
jgi:hypothetical protein